MWGMGKEVEKGMREVYTEATYLGVIGGIYFSTQK